MSSRLRPTPSMAVAVISLIVAISGTAVALPGGLGTGPEDMRRNSVGARALGEVFLANVAGLASTDPLRSDGRFAELEGSVRCPARAPFAFDPSIGRLGPLAYEVNRNVTLNRFGGPGGYEFEVMSDEGPGITFTMKVNCLARR